MYTKNAAWKLNSFANWYRKASTVYDIHSPNLFPLAKILQSGLHVSFQLKTQNRLMKLHRLFQPQRVVAEGIQNQGLKEWIQQNLQKNNDSPETMSKNRGPLQSTGEQIKTMIVLEAAHLQDFTSVLREDSPPACLVVLHIRKSKRAAVQWEFFQKGYKGAVIECWNTGLLYPLPPQLPRLHLVLCHYVLKPWRAGFFSLLV